jgi:hypothetical protein
MEALATAWGVYRAGPARADAWFVEATKLPFAGAVLTTAASVEPNVVGPDPIRVNLDPTDQQSLGRVAVSMRALGLLKQDLDTGAVVRPAAVEARTPRDAAAVAIRP